MPLARRIALLVLTVLALAPATASADFTAFIGPSFSGSPGDLPGGASHTTMARGLSVGVGLLIVGFEFEWAHAPGDDAEDAACAGPAVLANCAPSLTTVMGNVLLQTPRGLGPVQIYGTIGAGGYRERYDPLDESTTNVGTNVGGGVKISLLGPLRLRVDYRIFKLSGNAVHDTPQRLYFGANLVF